MTREENRIDTKENMQDKVVIQSGDLNAEKRIRETKFTKVGK